MSAQENKDLIRRYIEAIDANETSDWSVLDGFIAEDFVAHHAPVPGVSLDRDGMKEAAEIFRVAAPGRHEIRMQVAEDDLVVSHIVGSEYQRRTRRSRRRGSPSTESAMARSSSTGRSSMWRAFSSRLACCPARRGSAARSASR